jgi:hypothetical protein
MWCLETIHQINQAHARLGREQETVTAEEVYTECGIRTLGNPPRPVETKYVEGLGGTMFDLELIEVKPLESPKGEIFHRPFRYGSKTA